MSMLHKFRKDFFYYFAGIIIPGLINAASIPVFKNMLGAARFGEYSIYLNAYLLIVGSLVGWICQAVLRFRVQFTNPVFFYHKVFRILLSVTLMGAVICFGFLMYSGHTIYLPVIFGIGIIAGGVQNVMMSVSQSNFLAKATLFSESLRTVLFFLTGVLLLSIGTLFNTEKLFIALLFSYLISSFFLIYKNRISIHSIIHQVPSNEIFELKKFLSYGLPLALWFTCSYLITFIDKPYVAKSFGHTVQGNYQAIYDFIYRGSTIIIAPILTASFPLMNHAFENQSKKELNTFLKKLLFIEIGGILLAVLAYCLGGYTFLKYLLKIPDEKAYFWVGLFILLSAFIWQMGMLLHKPLEFQKKTGVMLINNVVSALVTFSAVFMVYTLNLPYLYYALGVLAGSVCYASLSFYHLRKYLVSFG